MKILATAFFFITLYTYPMDMVTRPKCFINELPLEVQNKIIKNVFDLMITEDEYVKASFDQKKLEKHHLRIPMTLGITYAQEFHQLQKICQKEIGGKKFLPQELFILPCNERDIFIRMAERANRSGIRLEFEGNISRNDLKTLMAIEDKNIKKGLELKVSRGGEVYYIAIGGMIMLCGSVIAASLLKFDETNFVHIWIGRIIMYSFLSSFPLVLIALFLKTEYMYDEHCVYDDHGKLRNHYRFQEGRCINYR